MELSVKTATGKEFAIRFCGATVIGVTSVLYIEFVGYSMGELVAVFSNSEETRHIQGLNNGEIEKEYLNYTNLIEVIMLAESQNIRIALTAPMDVLGQ